MTPFQEAKIDAWFSLALGIRKLRPLTEHGDLVKIDQDTAAKLADLIEDYVDRLWVARTPKD